MDGSRTYDIKIFQKKITIFTILMAFDKNKNTFI